MGTPQISPRLISLLVVDLEIIYLLLQPIMIFNGLPHVPRNRINCIVPLKDGVKSQPRGVLNDRKVTRTHIKSWVINQWEDASLP